MTALQAAYLWFGLGFLCGGIITAIVASLLAFERGCDKTNREWIDMHERHRETAKKIKRL